MTSPRALCALFLLLSLLLSAAAPWAAASHVPDHDDEEPGDDPPEAGDDEDRRDEDEDIEDDHDDAREDDHDDEDDFDDDDEGFEVRGSGVRFDRARSGFHVAQAGRSLDHRFVALIEFEDRDGDGAYGAADDVVTRHDLTRAPDSLLADGRDRTIQYNLSQGVLRFVVRNVASEAKFDVEIQDYRYRTASSRLALASSVAIEGGIQARTVDGQPAVTGTGTGAVPFLSWVPDVATDGGDATVVWSVLAELTQGGGQAIIYWAYPRSANVTHDPLLGFIHIPPVHLGQWGPFIAASMGAAAVGVLGYAARRGRR